MPLTLYRYILTQVFSLVVVSALVLVLVMAFATAIKPLSEGMLGVDTLVKFVLYMSPSMLQYALPFAAAMGATLVYIRMSQDNEILACLASGLTHRQLVKPMVFFGAGVMVLLLILSGGISPTFYRLAEGTARGDIVGMMVRKLNQGQPFVQNKGDSNVALFANRAQVGDVPETPAGKATPEYVVFMSGVVVARFDEKGKMVRDINARYASAAFYREENFGDAIVSIRLEEPQMIDTGLKDSTTGAAKAIDNIQFVVPSLMHDKVEFLSATDLWQLLAHPEKFDGIKKEMLVLSSVVAFERFRNSVVAALPLSTGAPLRGPLGNETYIVFAPKSQAVAGGDLKLISKDKNKVVVEHHLGNVLLRRWEGESGVMHFKQDAKTDEPVVQLTLNTVRVSDPQHSHIVTAKPLHAFDALVWPQPLLEDIEKLSVYEWLDKTQKSAAGVPALENARNNLIKEKNTLWRKVIANVNLRIASSLMCLLLSVLGATMSLWRRTSLPLVVFFWCFLVAVVSLILINTGASMARSEGVRFAQGLVILWLPIVGLIALNLWILARLKKPGG